MDADSIARKAQEESGWTDSTLLELCLQYIDNQKDNACFSDYLERQIQEEEDLTEEVLKRGYF